MAALPGVDAVILCCPLTSPTAGLLDERRLRMLPASAIVVNIARGPVIDEGAMIDALTEGHLGGACLDEASTEPPPKDSPLWDMGNVLISPHSASTVDSENAALTDLFCENLQRWLAGDSLRNVYPLGKGYCGRTIDGARCPAPTAKPPPPGPPTDSRLRPN